MKKVISTERIPIKLWLDDLQLGAMKQALNLANLPFAFKHIAIMPDAHEGYGMPIGGVLAADNVVVPNAVGVDIGCGMCAVKTSLKEIDKSDLKRIMGQIRKAVPVGFEHHKSTQEDSLMPDFGDIDKMTIVREQYNSARKQIGTLGGGNHFIEIQKGNDGFIWIMVHSGSRNLGKRVAEHYNKIAEKLNELWKSQIDKSQELAFLPIETKEAKQYLDEMNYCVDFALANRKLMTERIKECFSDVIHTDFAPLINIAHNYAAWEKHFDKSVIIHRKGATSARSGEIGIIPGSQGSKSYIVEGLGNPESFNSCSHGAGRKLGRNQALRELNLEEEIKKMDDMGVIHGIRNKRDLDEAAGAYKDIDEVMNNQSDLVNILVELKPLAVIKG